MNYLDLIKNPKPKNNPASSNNDATLKQVPIPQNLIGAQKNEWLEQQKKNQQNSEKKNEEIKQNNYSLPNNRQDPPKPSIQQQGQYQIPRNLSNGNKDSNSQTPSASLQKKSINQPQQQNNKQNPILIEDDGVSFRQSQNVAKTNNNIINTKQSIQFNAINNISSNSNKTININSNNKPSISQQIPNINTNSARAQQQQQQPAFQNNNAQNQRIQSNKSNGTLFSSNNSTQSASSRMSKQEMLRAKYSLQKQSKEDYKKIFSRIVKEYSDEENKYYDANKTKFTTYIILTLICISIVMVAMDVLASQTPKFCKTEIQTSTPNCIKCPENAKCKNSVMKCKDGYIQKNYECELNPNLISSSQSFIIEKIIEMQFENGNRICLASDIEGDQKAKEEVITIEKSKLIEELKSRILDTKTVETQIQILNKFLLNPNNQKEYDFTYDKDSYTLSSSRIRFTIFCGCKQFLKTNYRIIAISLIAFGLLIIFGLYMKRIFKQRQIAEEIYFELLNQIQESSEKSINISYYKEGIVSRYKGEFNENVWILVDKKRFADKKINVYRDLDGLYWSQL